MIAPTRRPQVVVIGTSAGGLRALEKILGALPPTYSLPIVVVQHRSKESDAFAEVMSSLVEMPVFEAEDKEPLKAPGVYLAPPDYHLLLEPGCLALSTDETVNFSRPSIDVMFESAADAYGDAVIGVLLTGANSDGHAWARKNTGSRRVRSRPRSGDRGKSRDAERRSEGQGLRQDCAARSDRSGARASHAAPARGPSANRHPRRPSTRRGGAPSER